LTTYTSFDLPFTNGFYLGGGLPTPGAVPLPAQQVRQFLAGLKVMNYYPAAHAQTNMWTSWDPLTMDADFDRIASLHANTVRVVLFPETFGYPDPSPVMVDRLAQVFALAAKHGLRLKLTLFGLWSDFSDVAGSKHWVQSILAPYRDSPQIAYIDLYNELDLANTLAPNWNANLIWARNLVPFVRNLMGSIPITISLSNTVPTRGLQQLKDARIPIDFYEVHYYGAPELAYQAFADDLRAVGGAPLFIGETGYPTQPASGPDPDSHTQDWFTEYQDQYLRTVQYAASKLGLPDIAPWTLYDYSPQAFQGTGVSAPNQASYTYGIYWSDGIAKPAASAVAEIFGGMAPDLSFNNGFENSDGSGLPANWSIWQPGSATFALDTTVSHSGTASARISNSGSGVSGEPGFYVAPVKPIQAGQTYSAGVWAEGVRASGTNRLELSWFDANNDFLYSQFSASLDSGTTGWTWLSVSGIAPANAAYVQIHLVSADNSGTVWFDDVTFN
jgi:hypothetical protein